MVLYPLQPDKLFSERVQSLCPTISGNVCCTEAQFETLRAQVQQVRSEHSTLFYLSVFLELKSTSDIHPCILFVLAY